MLIEISFLIHGMEHTKPDMNLQFQWWEVQLPCWLAVIM